MNGDWREHRKEAFEAHAAALERRKAAETQRARAQIADFVTRMREEGVAAHPLRARTGDGRATYRTGLTGWYVRRNRSLAIGADGEFYILDVPASVRARLFGAVITPSDPPLIVGAGARDGESMPLDELLARRAAAGADFP
ncbi:hypothetical protein CLV30_11463 [Haloactinopolyspora alba]|uniref:Uncharacterized protein n=1 Tax=Haloactinopolyspora alba TaxID=648780 RepID=A0A2P8DVS0_9ACTN|nr:hypothetical protein [Haloactinopolyspora alba]PSL01333.1 hypothetical protein CLV30_11463 [Haloactinopolyspora alba]